MIPNTKGNKKVFILIFLKVNIYKDTRIGTLLQDEKKYNMLKRKREVFLLSFFNIFFILNPFFQFLSCQYFFNFFI